MITETEFHKKADQELSFLYDAIEALDKENIFDIDLLNEVLHIIIPNGKEYVINKHSASKQIWVSSPISSANHFSYNENSNNWISRKNQELRAMIIKELTEILS